MTTEPRKQETKILTYTSFKCPNCDTKNIRHIDWNLPRGETELKLGFFCEDCGSFEPVDLVLLSVSEAEHRKGLAEKDKQIENLSLFIALCKKSSEKMATEHTDMRLTKQAHEGENAKIKTEIEDLKLTCSKQIYWEQESKITALRERLEAIRQWREKYKDKPVGVWAMSELGVLLSTSLPKGLDQKTREGDIK